MTAKKARRLLSYNKRTGLLRYRVDRYRARAGGIAGYATARGTRIGIDYRSYYAHRLAWLIVTGRWPREMIDHKNGNPNDNRWSNMREASAALNSSNRRKAKSATGVVGVRRAKSGRFDARIKVGYRDLHLGTFDSVREAKRARDRAAARRWGVRA